MPELIECPNCHTQFEISKALTEQLSEKMQQEFEGKLALEKSRLNSELQKIRQRETTLADAELAITQKIKDGISREKTLLEQQAKTKAREELSVELTDRDTQLKEMNAKLAQSKQNELALLKRERELKEQAEQQQIELNRKINEMADQIKTEAKKQALEEHRLKDAEKEKKISDLSKQIDELKLRVEQGSQQLQGEVMELALEQLLRTKFPRDTISEVPKGVRGADVLQLVSDLPGECGSILWESKRTRNWTHGWLEKLREDLRTCNASVAIIVTEALPDGCENFSLIDGVWVTNWHCAIGLALALRSGLVELARTNRSLVGKHEKAELVYNYLASHAFRNRVSGIVEAFVGLKADLDKEKIAIQRLWAKREKQLELALSSTTRMYGDVQAIMGAQLPELETLELPSDDTRQLPPSHE